MYKKTLRAELLLWMNWFACPQFICVILSSSASLQGTAAKYIQYSTAVITYSRTCSLCINGTSAYVQKIGCFFCTAGYLSFWAWLSNYVNNILMSAIPACETQQAKLDSQSFAASLYDRWTGLAFSCKTFTDLISCQFPCSYADRVATLNFKINSLVLAK